MNDGNKDKLALTAVISVYASIVTLVVRRFLHKPSAAPRSVPAAGPSKLMLRAPRPHENLQSLSASTPGEAVLDVLASRAAAEERGESRRQRAGASVETQIEFPGGPPLPWTPGSEAVAEVLSHQSLDGRLLQGWKKPSGDRLPVPTFAPAVMAFGIVVFAMGLATVWYVCAVGSLVFAVAAWRWAGELEGE